MTLDFDIQHFPSFPLDSFGQRALVGKVCMDCNSAVPQYKESSSECKEETDRWVLEDCVTVLTQ